MSTVRERHVSPPDALAADAAPTTRLAVAERTRGSTRRRGWVTRRALAVADLVGLTLAYAAATLAVRPGGGVDGLRPLGELLVLALALPLWLVAAKLYNLYDRDEEQVDRSRADDLIGVFNLVTVGVWAAFAFTRLSGLTDPDIRRLVLFWAGAIALVAILRSVARALCKRLPSYRQNVIVVGAGEVGQYVAQKLLEHPEYGVNLLGFVDANPRQRDERLGDLPILGAPDELPELVAVLDVERVIFAFSNDRHEDVVPLLRDLGESGVQIEMVPRFFDVIGPAVDVHSVAGLPVLGLRAFRLERSAQFLKRSTDVVVSALALVVLAPLFAVIAVLIKLDSRGPVFFRQVRMGVGARPFRIWKFRTMVADADDLKRGIVDLNQHLTYDARMFKAAGDPRVTSVGRLLRRFCLDELPQLFNVLANQMSLVGPRPLILDEARHVEGWALRRLDLKPGMTGLWQVLGASELPFDEMVKLDYRYVSGWSLKTDLELIARTIPAIVRERHAY